MFEYATSVRHMYRDLPHKRTHLSMSVRPRLPRRVPLPVDPLLAVHMSPMPRQSARIDHRQEVALLLALKLHLSLSDPIKISQGSILPRPTI